MFSIDMRTVIFFMALIDAISLLVITLLWVQNRKHFTGLNFWVVDYTFQMSAALLIILRGSVPDFISMVLSNTMVVGGTLILYVGLQRFVSKKSHQVHNYVLLTVFVFVHTYYTVIQPNLDGRTINLNAGLFIISFQIMWLMLRTVDSEISSLTRGVGIAFGGLGLVSLVRIIGLVVSPVPSNDLFKTGNFDTALVAIQQLFFILLTFSLILMVNRRLLIKVERLSNTDILTGFLNRRNFESLAEREMLLSIRHHQPLSLLYLDVDHFKRVNDTFGHEIGDRVLAGIAGSCRQVLRTTDISVRLGGEEFAFLCPHTNSPGAFILAERIRKAISVLIFNEAGNNLSVTVSIGVSEVNCDGDTLFNLIKRADEAMYQAKNLGINQVVIREGSSI